MLASERALNRAFANGLAAANSLCRLYFPVAPCTNFFPLLLTAVRPRAINPPAIISAGRHCKPLRFPAEVTMVYLALSCLNRDRRPMAGTECWQLITPCVGKPRQGRNRMKISCCPATNLAIKVNNTASFFSSSPGECLIPKLATCPGGDRDFIGSSTP